MTQKYELIVKGIRNFENKVTVTLALRDKERFDGEIFDLDISLDRVEGAALEFYEAAARRSIRQVFLDVAAGLCEGDELSPEKRPIILEAQNVWITYKGKLPGRITGWICPYISRHLLSLNPLQARCRRYSRGER